LTHRSDLKKTAAWPTSETHYDVEFASSATGARAFLDSAYRDWREGIGGIEEQGWWRPIGSAFGLYAKDSTVDLTPHVFDAIVHHGAEVGVLRDLYRQRGELGRS